MDKDKLNPPIYNDLIGDMLSNDEHKGEIGHLKGAGKPLSKEYLSGDTFQHFQRIAKDAGYKPYWLKLQHEIRDELTLLVERKNSIEQNELEVQITKINEKILEHNKACPPPLLKGRVSSSTIETAVERWK